MDQSGTRNGVFYGGMLADACLDTAPGHSVASQLAGWINTANTTPYDKAIDSVYLQTHVGGAQLHHLIDGHHDILGAFDAASRALPNDSTWQEVVGTAHHLGKDLFSVSGVPLFSVEPDTYHSTSAWLHDTFAVPKSWLGDLLQVNGLELFAGVLAAAAVVVGYQQADVHRLAELSGASGLAGALSANPLGLCAGAVALVMAWKMRHDPAALGRAALVGAGTVGAVELVGAGLGALGLGGGLLPTLGGLALSVVVGLYARKFLSSALHTNGAPHAPREQWTPPELPDNQLMSRLSMLTWDYPVSDEIRAVIQRRLSAGPAFP